MAQEFSIDTSAAGCTIGGFSTSLKEKELTKIIMSMSTPFTAFSLH